ncbi:hypothetical protein [Nannocystis punicea]|uniref:Beta-carotene 15,15'-dioxygenase n=1 Tax=Nannocystis punicea TaxID=2995304 RepID=A0ABY7HFG9_9BACT|nr:hypothetical protein [Nannocystis poenicansa]WAS98018.1 hypothetical protein O0S08_17900 [Nannocystis poenicansa]
MAVVEHAPAFAGSVDWLRGPRFDLSLIVGVLALALVLGAAGCASPALFAAVLVVDFWLLAYPHAASTFTRIAFDREGARAHAFLLFGLPPLVFAATAGAVALGGVLALNTIYFFWQSWHYTRQSYGIARAYHRSAGVDPAGDRLSDLVVFSWPLWGLLHRAHEQPALFYGGPIWLPPVPKPVVVAGGALALGALALWTARHLRALGSGRPRSAGHALFVLSHVVITAVSYLVVREITLGWLFINIWHNAQYLLFVWAMNARRFRHGVDPRRPFLSRLCQPDQALRYALVCLALSSAFYFTLGQAMGRMAWEVLPFVLICHQTVNFHHYIVDAVIWRSRGRAG